ASSRTVGQTRDSWPSMSVVVCAYNEERHVRECLASLQDCDYPDLEVIVCDDGSRDRTANVAREFPFEVLELAHGGLSAARNAGWRPAKGEIVAYLDADAMATPTWPFRLALAFDDPDIVAAGGPNLSAPDATGTEVAIDRCPGNPREVLLRDDRAEHVA